MASQENYFVVRTGLGVGTQALYADSVTRRVAIGKTLADYSLDIVGDAKIGIGSTAPIANIDGIGKTAYLGKVAVGYDDATTDIDTYNLAVDGKIVATEGVFAPSFNFTVASGIVTAFGGFVSYGNTAVQIFVEGSTLRFNVVGIGSTTLALI